MRADVLQAVQEFATLAYACMHSVRSRSRRSGAAAAATRIANALALEDAGGGEGRNERPAGLRCRHLP